MIRRVFLLILRCYHSYYSINKTTYTEAVEVMGQTQFKIYVMALRSCAGIFAAAGMALYVVILAKVADKRFPATAIGLTVLPLGAVRRLLSY